MKKKIDLDWVSLALIEKGRLPGESRDQTLDRLARAGMGALKRKRAGAPRVSVVDALREGGGL
jgi:hypothetical protein